MPRSVTTVCTTASRHCWRRSTSRIRTERQRSSPFSIREFFFGGYGRGGHPKRLRQPDHPAGLVIPTLWRVLTAVQEALRAHLVATFGECQQPAPRHLVCGRAVVPGQARDIDERRSPPLLDVRLSAVGVVGA